MILKRNFRYRHPISSKLINDWFTDIYCTLVKLIGIKNNKIDKKGDIKDLVTSAQTNTQLEINRSNTFNAIYTIEVYTRRNK